MRHTHTHTHTPGREIMRRKGEMAETKGIGEGGGGGGGRGGDKGLTHLSLSDCTHTHTHELLKYTTIQPVTDSPTTLVEQCQPFT